jgi:DNA polymerase-1
LELEVPISVDFEDIKYMGPNESKLGEIYQDLEFYSLIKKMSPKESIKKEFSYINILEAEEIEDSDEYAYFIECDQENYHNGKIVGMSVATKKKTYYVSPLLIPEVINKINDKVKYTFDLKKDICLLNDLDIKIENVNTDVMIAAYLLEMNVKDDIAYLMKQEGMDVTFYSEAIKNGFNKDDIAKKSRYIFDIRDSLINKLKMEDMYELFSQIEMPLISVLADMEYTGIKCDKDILDKMGSEVKKRIEELTTRIYLDAGEEFNIASPRQLGVILFEKLGLPYAKKTKTGYATDVKILNKLRGKHQIIEDILEYRNLAKLESTYLEGLKPYIHDDGKIHTIYKQNLTRTGRLSSVEPNLQNIPTRDEEGKKIRKAFLPSADVLMSCDYSQIELRLLAHISGSKELQQAFINGEDIHTRVAADIYGIPLKEVTKSQRKTAKAVIFGIVYGISGFGLGENLSISPKEAKEFIDKYYELYPGVKKYMDNIIKEAYNLGYVRTLFNRKRVISELQNKNYMIRQGGERIALNTPIQGTCADILKKAMVEIAKEFKEKGIKSKMLLQVHDELIFDVYNEEKDEVSKIVTDKMENAIKIEVPILVSHDFGSDWYETK